MGPFVLVVSIVAMSTPGFAKNAPLPPAAVITAEQAKECKFVNIFSASKLAAWSRDKSIQSALQDALKKAGKGGATSAVITGPTVDNNVYTMVANGYICPQ